MKTLILAMLISILPITIHASPVEEEILTQTQVCNQFGRMSVVLISNYFDFKATKEIQIKNLQEKAFVESPLAKTFEPGLVRIIDIIEIAREKLSVLKTNEEKLEVSVAFGLMVTKMCTFEGMGKWVQESDDVYINDPDNPKIWI